MTRDEAIDEAAYLKGLFNFLTDDQVKWWCAYFEDFEKPIIREAIKRYANLHSRDVDREGFKTMIRACCPKESARKVWMRELAEADQRRAAERDAKLKADQSLAQVDAVLSRFTDDALEKMKVKVLESMDEVQRKYFAGLDPKKSPTLRSVFARKIAEAANAR